MVGKSQLDVVILSLTSVVHTSSLVRDFSVTDVALFVSIWVALFAMTFLSIPVLVTLLSDF